MCNRDEESNTREVRQARGYGKGHLSCDNEDNSQLGNKSSQKHCFSKLFIVFR